MEDFTGDKTDLANALNLFKPEGGQTAIVDALYLAVDKMAKHKPATGLPRRRRALLLVTDGEDRDSFYKPDDLFKLLRETDVQIFVIGLVEELDKRDEKERLFARNSRRRAVDLLDKIAKETGGRAIYPRSPAEVAQAAGEIAREICAHNTSSAIALPRIRKANPIASSKYRWRKQRRVNGGRSSRAPAILHPASETG